MKYQPFTCSDCRAANESYNLGYAAGYAEGYAAASVAPKPDAIMPVEYFIVSVKHSARHHRHVQFFGPNDSGYVQRLHKAGRYSHEHVMGKLAYYNSGCSAVAVPCHILESVAVPPAPGYFDTDDGVIVKSNHRNWKLILANVIAKPGYEPKPEYKGARRMKVEI